MDDFIGSGDPGVDAFVDASLTSFAAWDVAIYLEQNSDMTPDAAELGIRLGRREYEVESVLNALVDSGVACAISGPEGVTRFALSSDPETRRVVSRFAELAKQREHRLEFVRSVLARMSRA